LGQFLQPCGDVDAITVDIIALNHDIAEVQPDPEFHAGRVRQLGVFMRQLVLDFDCALHRLNHGRKLDDDRIAPSIDDAPTMPCCEGRHDAAVGFQTIERAVFILLHEPGIVCNIRTHDSGQTALRPFHQSTPDCPAPDNKLVTVALVRNGNLRLKLQGKTFVNCRNAGREVSSNPGNSLRFSQRSQSVQRIFRPFFWNKNMVVKKRSNHVCRDTLLRQSFGNSCRQTNRL
jgi:hypothetical protein